MDVLNAYDAYGLLTLKESATPEELEVARAATPGYLSQEELQEDSGMEVKEAATGYDAYLKQFDEVEAILGEASDLNPGMPVTANCNSIADVREAIETAKVIRGIATEQRVEPMREVEKPPGSVRLMHESGLPVHEDAVSGGDLTGDKCPVCEGSRMTNGVVCEGCRGSGLVREASQKDDPPVKDPYEFDDVEDLEEDDAAVAAYMDDLEPDEDEPTATSVNSGKKKKRPESTARQHSNSQTATEPDNSFDAVMGPDDMQESGRIAPDWFVLGYRGPNDPDYLAAREMEESAASRADDGGVGLLAVCGLPTIQD